MSHKTKANSNIISHSEGSLFIGSRVTLLYGYSEKCKISPGLSLENATNSI